MHWATVCDAGPSLNRHWVGILGVREQFWARDTHPAPSTAFNWHWVSILLTCSALLLETRMLDTTSFSNYRCIFLQRHQVVETSP